MKEYIEREAVEKMLEDAQIITYGEWCGYCTEDINLGSIPAADVVPVRHGRWIVTDVVTCSECQHFTRSEFAGRWKYCPNCGALMREAEHAAG